MSVELHWAVMIVKFAGSVNLPRFGDGKSDRISLTLCITYMRTSRLDTEQLCKDCLSVSLPLNFLREPNPILRIFPSESKTETKQLLESPKGLGRGWKERYKIG